MCPVHTSRTPETNSNTISQCLVVHVVAGSSPAQIDDMQKFSLHFFTKLTRWMLLISLSINDRRSMFFSSRRLVWQWFDDNYLVSICMVATMRVHIASAAGSIPASGTKYSKTLMIICSHLLFLSFLFSRDKSVIELWLKKKLCSYRSEQDSNLQPRVLSIIAHVLLLDQGVEQGLAPQVRVFLSEFLVWTSVDAAKFSPIEKFVRHSRSYRHALYRFELSDRYSLLAGLEPAALRLEV